MQNTTNFHAGGFVYGGWKYYNTIKKKAMERKFSRRELAVSLSIAFFVVLIAAQLLSMAYASMSAAAEHKRFLEKKIYYLESMPRGKTINRAPNEKITAKA